MRTQKALEQRWIEISQLILHHAEFVVGNAVQLIMQQCHKVQSQRLVGGAGGAQCSATLADGPVMSFVFVC